MVRMRFPSLQPPAGSEPQGQVIAGADDVIDTDRLAPRPEVELCRRQAAAASLHFDEYQARRPGTPARRWEKHEQVRNAWRLHGALVVALPPVHAEDVNDRPKRLEQAHDLGLLHFL